MAILFAKTKQGTVEGKPGWNRAISVFKGIPFAAPPTGQNRWRAVFEIGRASCRERV